MQARGLESDAGMNPEAGVGPESAWEIEQSEIMDIGLEKTRDVAKVIPREVWGQGIDQRQKEGV